MSDGHLYGASMSRPTRAIPIRPSARLYADHARRRRCCVGGTASKVAIAARPSRRTPSIAPREMAGPRSALPASGSAIASRSRQAIVEFALKADTSYLTQVPKRFWLEWSDDGVNWRTAIGAVNETGWSNLQTRTFTKPSLVDGAAKTWAVRCLDQAWSRAPLARPITSKSRSLNSAMVTASI